MAKNPLAHAISQRDFHSAQAAKWDQYIALHQELYGDGAAGRPEPAPPPPPPGARAPRAAQVRGTIAETREAAHLILDEEKGYVASQTLIDRLEQLGVEVGGADPRSTLSARLSGDDEIESRRGLGYRLKKYADKDEAAGRSLLDAPAASLSTQHSAVEAGREVTHDNMTT